ncbi:MAG: hypothetical protein ACK41Y_16550, partial [Paracoccus hibiscisoli]|uniref:hypothetical protein n=1 Tax=Paracoccus hibiscisoli TaxID=2023261 RepID=UPI00391DF027
AFEGRGHTEPPRCCLNQRDPAFAAVLLRHTLTATWCNLILVVSLPQSTSAKYCVPHAGWRATPHV